MHANWALAVADLSNFLSSAISGASVNQYREKRDLIEIRMRGDQVDRVDVGSLSSLAATYGVRSICTFSANC